MSTAVDIALVEHGVQALQRDPNPPSGSGSFILKDDHLSSSQSAEQAQAPQGDPDPSGCSEALLSLYLDKIVEDDRKMAEDWKSNTDGMLTVTGLFSTVLAALLAVSVQKIERNPQDTSAFYLAHIYQQSSTQPNGSQPSIPSSLTNPIEPFIPPTSAVWVNGLWFLSLVMTLTCALIALLIQQWARRYLRVANRRCGTRERARLCAFYKEGVDNLHIPLTIEVIPVLLHISFFLFFAGLCIYLFDVHRTIFKVVSTWIGIYATSYTYLTFLPIFNKNSPRFTPFSSSVSHGFIGIPYLFFRVLRLFPRIVASMPDMTKTSVQYALGLDPSIDYRSLLWTVQCLDDDSDIEKFFEVLGETGKSENLQQRFIKPNKPTLSNALIGLMDRTLSSNLVPELVKQRRMIICTKAIESTSLFGPWWILHRVLLGDWHQFFRCIEFGLFAQNWKDITHPVTLFYRQCVAALTVLTVGEHDERWFQLARGLRDLSNILLHEYFGNGDSILLANTIFIVRRTVQTYSGSAECYRNDIIRASSKTLETVWKLDIQHTLPGLQHEFCGLWNQLVTAARFDPLPHHRFVATTTLKNIRELYIALHGCSDTPLTADDQDPILDNPASYPMCTTNDHRPSGLIPSLQFVEPTPDAVEGPSPPQHDAHAPPPTHPYPLIGH